MKFNPDKASEYIYRVLEGIVYSKTSTLSSFLYLLSPENVHICNERGKGVWNDRHYNRF